MPTIFQSQPPPRRSPSVAGREAGRTRAVRSTCRSLSFGGMVRGGRNLMALPGDRCRRNQGSREVLRRALMPPSRRPTLRWMNFRPTPSRLSMMSMAES
ncbi:uncharacterized protein E5676_scaffold110G002460 [Cucumis melo var. makuwa]|uniref:Uncharacterized protein n=2 Tax=Cucumis melo TaxID=3656 RepID=A0A5A7T5L7_CUCMM|nr:uncharacterized protein E6C27_scaffold20G001820 [Cucumis melo var. makuwa]TYJ95931.1 uncharacterized protein E5676_scaffold110G002460 [Cucumis melo var. makuwa]